MQYFINIFLSHWTG